MIYKQKKKLHYFILSFFVITFFSLFLYFILNPFHNSAHSNYNLLFLLLLIILESLAIYKYHYTTIKNPYNYINFSLIIVLLYGLPVFLTYLLFIIFVKYFLKKKLHIGNWVLNAIIMFFANATAGCFMYIFGHFFLDLTNFSDIKNFSIFAILIIFYNLITSIPYTIINKSNDRLSNKDTRNLFLKINFQSFYIYGLYHFLMIYCFLNIGIIEILIICIILFSTEYHIQQKSLIKLASVTDALTQVYNRGYFNIVMEKYKSENRSFCIIMIDIDNFKNINETYNHLVGDQVLIQFAQIIMKSLRDNDIIFRYGGEEFVVILENVDLLNTIIVSERIRENIEKKTYICHYNNEVFEIKHTSSLGISMYDLKNPNNVLEEADNNLKIAKHTGKNKLHHHNTDYLEKILTKIKNEK
jgi:diguanylate cyclase (GGDEF)-like protein